METKIIQITSGRGPVECEWVVAKVLKFFLKELEKLGVAYQILDKENGFENRTVQSVILQLEGKNLTSFLQNWIGTIQWIGTSTFRKHHKRKNWFVGYNEISQKGFLKGMKIDAILMKDIQFQAIRSSGAGGQHVNKVSSAVRAKHIPTGIQILVMDSRSQHQNTKIAVQRLTEKLEENQKEQLKIAVKNQWQNHLTLDRGNPVRIFKGTDFKSTYKERFYKSKRMDLKNKLKQELWD